MKKLIYNILTLLMLFANIAYAQLDTTWVELKIKLSVTDARITNADYPHLIMYDTTATYNKLMVFLPGTFGIPEKGPKLLFQTAMEKGHQVINLAYIDQQSVARICSGKALENDNECTRKFREKRVFGAVTMTPIPDEPHDAIVNRLEKLLAYLVIKDPKGKWGKYLINGTINWKEVILTGQSQGGGMAAFIAKRYRVARVLDFSGGWDYKAKGEIAGWYFDKSVTPAKDWFGTYHVQEPAAKVIDKTYKAMNIPENQIYGLDLEVQKGRKAHSQAIRNIAYKELWLKLFDI